MWQTVNKIVLYDIFTNQPCQHRLSQLTTPSTNTGHHWQCMAREHPSKETTGPAQTRKAKRYENEQSEMANSARAAFA